tara:strand:- start:4297 stop:4809 length:513 start_codon:yes stop_codon:yes gene_type:complete
MTHSNSNNSYLISVSKKLVLFIFIVVVFFNCKNKEEKTNENTTGKSVEEKMERTSLLDKGCYMYNQDGNMVTMEITKNDNPVEGNLTYALAEKDKNTGTFKGAFNNDKLIGSYTFLSEGKESKREIAFTLKDKQLVEGYGEMNENGTAFVDKSKISYTSTMALKKTDCGK